MRTRNRKTASSTPLAYIAADIRPLAVPIGDLHPDPRNPRTHDEANLAAIAASLREFGQLKPLVCHRETHIVEAGNGVLAAAGQLGWTHLAVVWVEHDATAAAGFVIADNRTAELATWDDATLAALIGEVESGLAEALQLQELAPEAESSAAARGEDDEVEEEYSVLVRCQNEKDQKIVLKELDRHGLDVRALCVGWPKPEPIETEPPAIDAVCGRVIERSCGVERTVRVMQLEGMFDVAPEKRIVSRWEVDLVLDQPWQVGLIVGPSGSGKSMIARELFGPAVIEGFDWPQDQAILDGFPEKMTIQEITGLLSSVGFSSPPAWRKPFHVLSNGERFRVTLARALAERPELCVVDEFSSVVDRQVAQIGSAAVVQRIRRGKERFVAVTCHYDVEDWLQPDWRYDAAAGELVWRSLQRRPPFSLRVRRVGRGRWDLYGKHHYLAHNINRASACFEATIDGAPAAFVAVIHCAHWKDGGWWREHRCVCLPDFQGVGIGTALSEFVGSMYACKGVPYRSTTSHPAMIRHRSRSPQWRMLRAPSLASGAGRGERHRKFRRSTYRLTAGFEYIGPLRWEEAERFGVL